MLRWAVEPVLKFAGSGSRTIWSKKRTIRLNRNPNFRLRLHSPDAANTQKWGAIATKIASDNKSTSSATITAADERGLILRTLATSGVASPEIWEGPKCLILGEWPYFVWKNASQSTKWPSFLKIWGGMAPLDPPVCACACNSSNMCFKNI